MIGDKRARTAADGDLIDAGAERLGVSYVVQLAVSIRKLVRSGQAARTLGAVAGGHGARPFACARSII
ncbi:MAG: hypothetical protein WKF30_10935 [Pyrinomonadaceae bacterium]